MGVLNVTPDSFSDGGRYLGTREALAHAERMAAQAADWAPIRHHDTLHDRASYRYFWQVLQRAQRTAYAGGAQLPTEVRQALFDPPGG